MSQTKILIHAVEKRLWYVDGFLIPALTEQGIERENINVWVDVHNFGNLESCIESFEFVGKEAGGTWHLQDDVMPARNFAETARQYTGNEIACGFCVERFDTYPNRTGYMPERYLWLSFPCIYIPNETAVAFARWYRLADADPDVCRLRNIGKGDDTLFWLWYHNNRASAMGWNIAPNMVEHVDWLIGGSIANADRTNEPPRAKYWTDDQLVKDLENRIRKQT